MLGFYLTVRRHPSSSSTTTTTTPSLDSSLFVVDKRQWDVTPIGTRACKKSFSLGPSQHQLTNWVRRNFFQEEATTKAMFHAASFDTSFVVTRDQMQLFFVKGVYGLKYWRDTPPLWDDDGAAFGFPPVPCPGEIEEAAVQADNDDRNNDYYHRTCASHMSGSQIIRQYSMPGSTQPTPFTPSTDPPPRIYVYRLPSHLTTGFALAPRRGRAEHMVRLEEELHHAMLTSPLRTHDPANADLFYIPLYPVSACVHLKSDCLAWNSAPHCAGCRVAMAKVVETMEYVRGLGYYTTGPTAVRNHLAPFVYDYGRCMDTFSKDARENNYPPILKSIIAIGPLGTDRNQECFVKQSDVVVAPFLLRWQTDALEVVAKARIAREEGGKEDNEDKEDKEDKEEGEESAGNASFSTSSPLFVYFRGDTKQGPDGTFRRRLLRSVLASADKESVRAIFIYTCWLCSFL